MLCAMFTCHIHCTASDAFANETLAVQTKCQPLANHELSIMVVMVSTLQSGSLLIKKKKHQPGQRHAKLLKTSNPPAYFCAAHQHPAAILNSKRQLMMAAQTQSWLQLA